MSMYVMLIMVTPVITFLLPLNDVLAKWEVKKMADELSIFLVVRQKTTCLEVVSLKPGKKCLTGWVEQISESHDSLRRDVLHHPVVEPQRAPPLDRKELDPLSRLDVKSGKVFLHQSRDVVAEDVRVPDDRRVVHNLTDSMNNKDLKNICFVHKLVDLVHIFKLFNKLWS